MRINVYFFLVDRRNGVDGDLLSLPH